MGRQAMGSIKMSLWLLLLLLGLSGLFDDQVGVLVEVLFFSDEFACYSAFDLPALILDLQCRSNYSFDIYRVVVWILGVLHSARISILESV